MSERPDDDRRQALDQRLASLRKLQLAARIVAVVAALITLGWLVLGILSLSGDLGIRTVSERLERPSDVPDSA